MVNSLNQVVDYQAIIDHFIERDGFIFLPLTYPYDVFDAILIRSPQDAPCSSPYRPYSKHNLEAHIALINELSIEKAVVIANNINFINACPSLKHLWIIPADNAGNNFDYSPLYGFTEIKSLRCATFYGRNEEFTTSIDCSRLNGIESIGIPNARYLNYQKLNTLKSLALSSYKEVDLHNAFTSLDLDTLSLIQCSVRSLNGIERSRKMQCLYLYYNRTLQDISALKKVKKTLRALRIENCPKINDFTVLGELENLELLELSGSNELPNLDFLRTMHKLKTFIFSMPIKDGDLSACLDLCYVLSKVNRKCYNLKNENLPKGKIVRGNETVDSWRRLE